LALRAEGREAEHLEIAKNLLAQGLAIELIEQATGIHRSLFNA
jgi:predicted transposase YdaD